MRNLMGLLALLLMMSSANAQFKDLTDSTMVRGWNFMHNTGDPTSGLIDLDSNSLDNVLDIDFEIMTTDPSHQEGLLFYDKPNHTLALFNDESDITLQIGQEFWIRVQVDVAIDNGELAYHVLDAMHAVLEASSSGQHIELTSACERPAPLPADLPEYQLEE